MPTTLLDKEKGNGSQQARLYRSCLLAADGYIDKSACITYHGRQENIPIKHYHLSRFEWEDVVRYSIVIVLGSIINYLILDSLL